MNELLSTFGLHRTAMVLSVTSNVIRAFEQEFAQDHNAKTAALATLIAVLQQHQAASTQPQTPAQ